jgi:membrane-associated phospholipid phosphatase
LGIVHALKWAVGRARPFEVLYTGAPFSAWYDIGPHFVTEGIYHGSFPSGHTAQAALLLTVAYVLASGAADRPALRPAAWLWTLICLSFITAMGAARVMALSHWLTDVIAGLFFTWIGVHVSYHWILKIPAQTFYFRETGSWPRAPEAWELRLSVWLLGALAGFSAAMLGTRALFRPGEADLGLLLPLGAALLIVCVGRFRRLRKRAFRQMEGQTT